MIEYGYIVTDHDNAPAPIEFANAGNVHMTLERAEEMADARARLNVGKTYVVRRVHLEPVSRFSARVEVERA